MRTSFVTTTDGTLLSAVRDTISGADEVLICVAYMKESGVRLLEKEFAEVTKRGVRPRLLVTTALGTTDANALKLAEKLKLQTRIYNPGRGTFHPKIYLGRHGQSARAFIGSANMTSGLAGNVEAGLAFEGAAGSDVIRSAWDWASRLWDDPVVEYWDPATTRVRIPAAEEFDRELFPLLMAAVKRDPVFLTLDRGKPNRVTDTSKTAIYVSTERSYPRSEEVPAWMFNIAWAYLRTHGELSNDVLLNELRVHRSSAVRAVLARIPGVKRVSGGVLSRAR